MANQLDENAADVRRTTHDAPDMGSLRTFVRLMDDAVQIPGTSFRVGLDALIGLIPGVGDIAGGIMSGMVIVAAARAGAPRSLIARMVGNTGIDVMFGAVPILGDLFDAGWKTNRRNLNLLERYLERPAATRRTSMLFVIGALAILILLVVASVAAAIWLTKTLIGLSTN